MIQDYKITKVSEQPPKEWDSQYGKLYYHKVMLEGHNKPVTIGSKKPEPPTVGDTVYGDIQVTDYPEDKFKKANKFPAQNNDEVKSKLEAIHGDIKLLMSWVRQEVKKQDTVVDVDPEEDITVGDMPDDEEIKLEDIPF